MAGVLVTGAVQRSWKLRAKTLFIDAMRFALLRPRLKRLLMRVLSLSPALLMAIKKVGVRAGLAAEMGVHQSLQNGMRHPGHARLSVRAARIYRELDAVVNVEREP